MSRITPNEEKQIRESLKARAQKPDVLGANFPVYISRLFVTSEQDIVEKIGVEPQVAGQNKELKFLQIELVGLDDGEGEDNCPIVILTYRFHLSVGFVFKYAPGSTFENSTDEFNALLINLRNEFSLNDNVLDDDFGDNRENVTSDALTRENFIVIDIDPFAQIDAHYIDQTTRVEFS